MVCTDAYPDEPPIIQFTNPPLRATFVDPETGLVDASKVACLEKWSSSVTLAGILTELRKYIHNEQLL